MARGRCERGYTEIGGDCKPTGGKRKWNGMSQDERLAVLRDSYPFEYLLYTEQFKGLSQKSWDEFPEGITKNHVNNMLTGGYI